MIPCAFSYINYGGLGTILGHELGHGMDSNGICTP